ncbi:MAG TPA: hypothetical protein VI160_11085, partial [Gemmatimonadales bacterium]
TGAAAAAVRWALPSGHPATEDAWLPGLINGYEDTVRSVSQQFLHTTPQPDDALTLDEFRAALDGGRRPETIRRFLETERRMCEMGRIDPERDVADRFARYREWARFSEVGRMFVRDASTELGLDPELLFADPRRVRF